LPAHELVGIGRFELPTSSTPCWRDTWLRYIPFDEFPLENTKIDAKIYHIALWQKNFLKILKDY
jgi:hypothetical protein